MSEMKKIYITGLWLLCIVYGVSAQTYDIIERRNSWNTGKMLQVSGWIASLLPMPNCMVRITMVISTTLTKRRNHGMPEQ